MNAFKLLVVEDNEQDLRVCKDSVNRYKDEKKREFVMVECKSLAEAVDKLDNSFDGAIIDLKLDKQGNEGNLVIQQIKESYLRIPIAILTGTPDTADRDITYIGVFKKGEIEYTKLFDLFWGVYNTGLTRIMGGRGIIEQTLNAVFLKNILVQKEKWVAYGDIDTNRTERALLRHTLNHLLQFLDTDEDKFFPEEVYIYPVYPPFDYLRTGSIIKKKKESSFFVVMNPSCDLAKRKGGGFKTDRILLIEIESYKIVVDKAIDGVKKDKKEDKIKAILGNNYTLYYHWLPDTNFFDGGFLNFRKLTTVSKQEFEENYAPPVIQISPFFVKDIVARFSSFYARQGQPDIDYAEMINHFLNRSEDS